MEHINFMDWIDLLWVPLTFFALHKGQRIKAVLFVLSCILTLRLQIELMEEIGYPDGILPLIDYSPLHRGYMTYGAFIAVFLILSHISREKDPYVFIAAAITVFIAAFCVSSFILVL